MPWRGSFQSRWTRGKPVVALRRTAKRSTGGAVGCRRWPFGRYTPASVRKRENVHQWHIAPPAVVFFAQIRLKRTPMPARAAIGGRFCSANTLSLERGDPRHAVSEPALSHGVLLRFAVRAARMVPAGFAPAAALTPGLAVVRLLGRRLVDLDPERVQLEPRLLAIDRVRHRNDSGGEVGPAADELFDVQRLEGEGDV